MSRYKDTNSNPCPFYECTHNAVFDIDEMVLQPCWEHQKMGFAIRRDLKSKIRHFLYS